MGASAEMTIALLEALGLVDYVFVDLVLGKNYQR